MKDNLIHVLEDCVADLKKAKAQMPNNLEPGMAALLDSVVTRLEQVRSASDREDSLKSIQQALELLGRIGQLMLAAVDVVDRFRG